MNDEITQAFEMVFAAPQHRSRERLERPGNPFSCDGMDVIIPGVQHLLAAGRAKGIPVVYTTTALRRHRGPEHRHGHLAPQDPARGAPARERRGRDRRADRAGPGEQLKAAGVDTVVVTCVTMAGCVRHTVEDAIAEGFRTIVVRDCVGDRVAGLVEWNLFASRRQVRRRRGVGSRPRVPRGRGAVVA